MMEINDIYYNALAYVLFKVTPSLRYIYLDFQLDKQQIILRCYFEKAPSETEKELMNDIADNIFALIDVKAEVRCDFIVSQEQFETISKTPYPIYARFET